MVPDLDRLVVVYVWCFAKWTNLFALLFGCVTVKIWNANAEVLLHKLVVRLVSLVVNIIVQRAYVLLVELGQAVLGPVVEARRFVRFVFCANGGQIVEGDEPVLVRVGHHAAISFVEDFS